MEGTDRIRWHRGTLITTMVAVLGIVIGLVAGILIGRASAPLPESCREAVRAAESVAAAIEEEWATASAAVDATQRALDDSDLPELAAECLR
ncbi:hypothetical protein EF847_22425 [Actinobacteria bacterium YIM 96077]|uniref:Uncharacterized protein n=1 Tax=Phytoactinopolyspora halophila TaxID=1981511 RepID=A0A329QPU9_9ACTN|nr:hypothetical protein [Phytoactinopolyspora halophila]AYY15038.1 hypothetical protein EF847_22425 [Actinobacteria bacterium YIM 96077]RAW14196.1 hypothetical protein DPM12_11095 [Phytoactinopolyspora halophila]